MNILVTGATGLVGNLIARRLTYENHHEHALVRDPQRATHIKDVVAQLDIANLTLPATLPPALGGIETVVHCAGLVGSGRSAAADYFRINAEGTHNLVQAATHYDRLMLINQGRMIAFGTPDEIYTPDNLAATFGDRIALIRDGEHYHVIADKLCDDDCF